MHCVFYMVTHALQEHATAHSSRALVCICLRTVSSRHLLRHLPPVPRYVRSYIPTCCEICTGCCVDCPIGVYGSSAGLTSSSCSGLCAPGKASVSVVSLNCIFDALPGAYGNSAGQTSPSCSGLCTAGFYCPAGSTSAIQNICPLGDYCPVGSAAPTPCPLGTRASRCAAL